MLAAPATSLRALLVVCWDLDFGLAAVECGALELLLTSQYTCTLPINRPKSKLHAAPGSMPGFPGRSAGLSYLANLALNTRTALTLVISPVHNPFGRVALLCPPVPTPPGFTRIARKAAQPRTAPWPETVVSTTTRPFVQPSTHVSLATFAVDVSIRSEASRHVADAALPPLSLRCSRQSAIFTPQCCTHPSTSALRCALANSPARALYLSFTSS